MEEIIARTLQLFLALAGAWALALWFALAVWTYRDITSRTTNPITHVFSTLMVVLFWVPGAVIYLILRPRETLEEAFQRSMEEEYLLQDLDDFPICPSCRRSIRDDFVFCPHCGVELRGSCRACARAIDLRWENCPYCGASQRSGQRPQVVPVPDTGGHRPPRWTQGESRLQAIDGGLVDPQEPGHESRPREDSASAVTAAIPVADAARIADKRPVRDRGGHDPGSEPRPVESGS